MDNEFTKALFAYLGEKKIFITEEKPISYGAQFSLNYQGTIEKIRIYQNNKGKITLDASPVKAPLLKELIAGFRQKEQDEKSIIVAPPLIGTDEAGKGDYFGPLCVSAVYADKSQFEKLIDAGVKDSKLLKDPQIHKLAIEIKRICPVHEIVIIGAEKFNEMYAGMKNLGMLLGWAHGAAINKVFSRCECINVLTDKYGSDRWLEMRVSSIPIKLTQQPKAEANAAVAAASILARDAFVSAVARMSRTYGISIPLGASSAVDDAARELVEKFGPEELKKAVKISFKNTERII